MFRSSEILDVIAVAKTFKTTPSDILGIDEEETYIRYCIDEACTYIYNKMQPDKEGNIEEPVFPSDADDRKSNKSKNEGLDFLKGL